MYIIRNNLRQIFSSNQSTKDINLFYAVNLRFYYVTFSFTPDNFHQNRLVKYRVNTLVSLLAVGVSNIEIHQDTQIINCTLGY